MGKRSNFDRKDKDFYVTPLEAMIPLLPFLTWSAYIRYCDPCCGTLAIQKHLDILCDGWFPCGLSSDYYKKDHNLSDWVFDYDARIDDFTHKDYPFDVFITNPPWDRSKKNGEILHKIIDNLAGQKPTWLLFDADWMHTKQSAPYMAYCVKVVAVGRVKWFPDTKQTGKDNVCWYLFDKSHNGPTEFVGRT